MARKKQGYLPDMEPPSVAEIDTAADEYVEVRDQRMQLTTVGTRCRGRDDGAEAKTVITVLELHEPYPLLRDQH